MKLKTIKEVDKFLEIVDSCRGEIIITSQYGDRYNLKSKLNKYVAVGELIGDNAENLELWCDYKEDEAKFLKFLKELKEEQD